MDDWKWPPEFPKDCPPTGANAANGTYYRIVRSNPPHTRDFIPMYYENRSRAEKMAKDGKGTLCETMGLSVYSNIEHAVQCASQYPKNGSIIAAVQTVPECGKILQNPRMFDSHNTWWVVQGFDPTTISEVVHQL